MRLFDLPIHLVSRWIFNCYVVEAAARDDGRTLVVDAGLPTTAALAVDVLRELGAAAPVTVVATHGHSDHVGGIPRLKEAFTARVHLPARCRAYLAGEAPRTPGARQVAKILPVLGDQPFAWRPLAELAGEASRVGYGRAPRMRAPFPVDGFLGEGDAVEHTDGWRALHAPGHTDDSTCLYHADTQTLLSGDAVLTHGGRAWINPEVVDPELSRRTEERLRALPVRHLLPGHGRPIEGRHLLRDARSFRERPPGRGALERLARRLGRWD